MTDRPVIWELHIMPMFRLIDRDHMLLLGETRRVDLYDYDQVVARSRTGVMQKWLHGHMPPVNVGGPWPAEWLALYDRWVTGGFKRLGPVTATYTATRSGDTVLLVARGEKPADEDEVWLERISPSESPREYALVREPVATEEDPSDFTVRERFAAREGVYTVIVTDAAGRHEVTIA